MEAETASEIEVEAVSAAPTLERESVDADTASVAVASSEALAAAFASETAEVRNAQTPEAESVPEAALAETKTAESPRDPVKNDAPFTATEFGITQAEPTTAASETPMKKIPAELEVSADTSGLTGDGVQSTTPESHRSPSLKPQ